MLNAEAARRKSLQPMPDPYYKSVDSLQETLGRLLREREELSVARADRVSLEQNRLEIVALHGELRKALVAQYAPNGSV
jgi:hypothetical protein